MMIFLVYAAETDQTIGANLGLADYSYFFVMKKFLPVLERLGRVLAVADPATIDAVYDAQRARGRDVILLSFTPPHKTPQALRCPTFPVFAWEYSTIPNEVWGNDPRHNWAAVLESLPGAITHSRFAVDAVRAELGDAYPLASLPAPLWDEYASLYRTQAVPRGPWQLDIARGVVLDSHAMGLHAQGHATEASFEEKPCSVRFDGIVYTTVFNPNDGRKNWLDLISAFCFAFRDNPEATLLMKLAYHDTRLACGMVWHEMKKLAPYRCRVVAVQGYLDGDAYRGMVASSTYVVNTAHGEGQCLPLMEFMSAGKPAIAPNHSAMADYIDAGNAFVVGSSEEWTHWPHDPRLVLRAFRYRIDWESLRDAYLESFRIASSQPEIYRRMARQAHLTQRQQCGREVIAARLKEFLEGLGYAPRYRSALEIAAMNRLSGLRLKIAARRNALRNAHAAPAPVAPALPPVTQLPPAPTVPVAQPDPSLADACMSGWFRNDTCELLEGFAIAAEDTVLDVGCGSGGVVSFCARHGAEVIFSDIDAGKVAAVEKRLAGSGARAVRGVVSDSNPLPLPDATATRVICMEVLEHVDDPAQVMRELLRVGRPGARYLLTVPDPASEAVLKKVAPAAFFEKPNHIRVFQHDEFEQLIADAGLVIERRVTYGFYWSLWWIFFCACDQEFEPPWHPLLEQWMKTWETLLTLPQGPRLKQALDEALPKSQAIIARKPL